MSPAADDASALRSEMMLFACAHNDAMFAPTCRSAHHALKALIIAEGKPHLFPAASRDHSPTSRR